MIVDHFYFERITVRPPETNSPLVVNADAPTSGPVAFKLFKAIGRRDAQIVSVDRVVQHPKLPQGDLLNLTWKTPGAHQFKDSFSLSAPERSNHGRIL